MTTLPIHHLSHNCRFITCHTIITHITCHTTATHMTPLVTPFPLHHLSHHHQSYHLSQHCHLQNITHHTNHPCHLPHHFHFITCHTIPTSSPVSDTPFPLHHLSNHHQSYHLSHDCHLQYITCHTNHHHSCHLLHHCPSHDNILTSSLLTLVIATSSLVTQSSIISLVTQLPLTRHHLSYHCHFITYHTIISHITCHRIVTYSTSLITPTIPVTGHTISTSSLSLVTPFPLHQLSNHHQSYHLQVT